MSKTTNKFSPEVRERAVRTVVDHEGEHASRWAAVASIAVQVAESRNQRQALYRQIEELKA